MLKNKSVQVSSFLSHEVIERKIYLIRGKKVMLGHDLAGLYQVETGELNRQVKRNPRRFPEDFMFQVTQEEFKSLRCQIGISNRGGMRYLPYAFTEHGIMNLSSVLNSPRALEVNLQIMRTFVKQRELLMAHKDLKSRIDDLEKKYDGQFQVVFKAIKLLVDDKKSGGEDNNKRFKWR